MKKLVFLGAAQFQIPPIQYALSQGYYVITCDNRPENPGHKLAHQHYIVSTIEKEAILNIAKTDKIDGILAFGSDVSAPTAAYVAEKMDLPGNPYETVVTLTNKALFRDFVTRNGIEHLYYQFFTHSQRDAVNSYLRTVKLPAVIKPVDSAGSKGVSIISSLQSSVDSKIDYAFAESISKKIIVESYIGKIGKQICGDGFMEDSRLRLIEFGDGHFYDDGKFLAPFAETFPSTHRLEYLHKVKSKLEHTLIIAGFTRGPFNFDVWITENGEPFINEIGPRSGGNYIPTAITLQTNVDVIAATVESALDWNFKLNLNQPRSDKFHACYMIHSLTSGVLRGVKFEDTILNNIVQYNPYLSSGSQVKPFYKAGDAIGNIVLRFDSTDEMLTKIANMRQYCSVILD